MNAINETISLMESQATAYTPGLITLWVTLLISMPIVALLFKSKKSKWGDFWLIYFFTILVTGIVMTFLIIAPEGISSTVIWAKDFFLN